MFRQQAVGRFQNARKRKVRMLRNGLELLEPRWMLSGNPPEFFSPVDPDYYAFTDVALDLLPGDVVGTISATDAEGDPLTYSGGGFTFDVDPSTGDIIYNGNEMLYPDSSYFIYADVFDGTDFDYADVEIWTVSNNAPEFDSPEDPDLYTANVQFSSFLREFMRHSRCGSVELGLRELSLTANSIFPTSSCGDV